MSRRGFAAAQEERLPRIAHTLPAPLRAPLPVPDLTFDSLPPADAQARERFFAALQAALDAGQRLKLVLAKPRGDTPADLKRVSLRPVLLRGELCLSAVFTHATRDVTKNWARDEALPWLQAQIGPHFGHAHLMTASEDLQLLISRKGKHTLQRHAVTTRSEGAAPDAAVLATHDREKHRHVPLDRPFLAALGVTHDDGRLVPAMARKWKQIDKFVEVFDSALRGSRLAERQQVRVVDFGSGKGYLTFAVHDHLRRRGLDAQVTGVELRPDMVALCERAARELHAEGLRFLEGDVRTHDPGPIDVMIALHACDTATDHAIHLGLRGGAEIILCSPCCHKEVRPQLMSPQPLRPLLKHGVHLGQQAEMLTDGLRAMLLEWAGYETQVFEFVSLEHTNKNKMILAVRRPGDIDPVTRATLLSQIQDIKGFYGVREQCLERLLLQAAPAL
jgi:hypothetical protein